MADKAAKRKKGGDDDDDMAESDDEDLPRSAPAVDGAVDDAVDDDEDEANSDDEEAEVWKVRAVAGFAPVQCQAELTFAPHIEILTRRPCKSRCPRSRTTPTSWRTTATTT
jgi:hypothetical protein